MFEGDNMEIPCFRMEQVSKRVEEHFLSMSPALKDHFEPRRRFSALLAVLSSLKQLRRATEPIAHERHTPLTLDSTAMRALARFDLYRKVPRDLTEPTLSGAIVSCCTVSVALYLVAAELLVLLSRRWESEMIIEESKKEAREALRLG